MIDELVGIYVRGGIKSVDSEGMGMGTGMRMRISKRLSDG